MIQLEDKKKNYLTYNYTHWLIKYLMKEKYLTCALAHRITYFCLRDMCDFFLSLIMVFLGVIKFILSSSLLWCCGVVSVHGVALMVSFSFFFLFLFFGKWFFYLSFFPLATQSQSLFSIIDSLSPLLSIFFWIRWLVGP